MPEYLNYLLKASACLSFVYLFYVLLLRYITYYSINRYFLLIYCMLAYIIPSMRSKVIMDANQFDGIRFLNQLPSFSTSFKQVEQAGSSGINITGILTAVFYLGLLFMLVRLVVQLLSLWKMHLRATLLQDGKVRVYHLNEPIIPFSYFNNIYLNKNNYSEHELAEIVNHELVHVQQKHAIDILISELICMLNWYNPIAWLLKKSIRENLEFIADQEVIKKGAVKKDYQYLLLKVTGSTGFSIAANLNFSSLKSRINMMNRTRTSAFHLFKFILLAPVVTLVLLAFRGREEVFTASRKEQRPAASTYLLHSISYSIPDKKLEAIVKKEANHSFLKPGTVMNLDFDLFLHERERLKALLENNGFNLEKTGYANTGNYGIIFMVDTTSGNRNLSVRVNINLDRNRGSLSSIKDNSPAGNMNGLRHNSSEALTSSIEQSSIMDGVSVPENNSGNLLAIQ